MKKGSAEIIVLLPLLVVLLFAISGLMSADPNGKLEDPKMVGLVIGFLLIMAAVCFCVILIPAMVRENRTLETICSQIVSNCKKEEAEEKK